MSTSRKSIIHYHTLSLITDPRTSDQRRPRNARGDPLLRNSWAIGAWFEFNTFSPIYVRSTSKFGKFSTAGISGFTPSNGIPCANSKYIRLCTKNEMFYNNYINCKLQKPVLKPIRTNCASVFTLICMWLKSQFSSSLQCLLKTWHMIFIQI